MPTRQSPDTGPAPPAGDGATAPTAQPVQSDRAALFSRAGHDLRQQLHAMKLLTQSALDDATVAGTNDPLPLRRLAGLVDDLGSRLTDLLEIARLERGAPQPQRTWTALQDVFQQLDLGAEDRAAARGIDLRLRTTDLALHTDPALLLRLLERAVSAALSNARSRVLVAARRRCGGVAIEVRHDGPAPAACPGFGLAVVERLAEILQWRIDLEGAAGTAGTLTLRVPAGDVAG